MSAPDLHALFLHPDIRRKRLVVSHVTPALRPFRVEIDGTPYSAESAQATAVVEMPEFQLWSPYTPVVYTARCFFLDDANANSVEIRFAMREFTIKENRFHINGKPVILRGVVLVPADTAACDDHSARMLVAALKKADFNFLRMKGAPIPEVVLEAADESGVFVCDELAEQGPSRIESIVAARRNHASIVLWHIPADDDGALLRRVQQFDPSRAVVSNLDRRDAQARFIRPYSDDMAPLDAITAQLPPPCSPRAERFYEHAGEPGQPVLFASFGAQGNPCAVADMARRRDTIENGLAAHELSRIFASFEELSSAIDAIRAESLKLQIQAARVNGRVAGYCIDGIVPQAASLSAAQSPLALVIRASRTNLVPREEVPVTVTLVNDERVEPIADLSLQVVGPTNQVLWKKKRSIKAPKQTREIWSGTISASGSVGMHRFVVRLMQGMKLLAQNSLDLHVVEPAQASDVEVSVIDPYGEWTQVCTALARPAGAKPRLYVVPPLANTVRAYPNDALFNLLNEVRAGAVAIVFSPPEDWNDLATRIDESLKASSVNTASAFHYARLHPIFDGLPSRCLLFQPYRNVVPRKSFDDNTDERVCGAIALSGAADMWCGEDILVRRFGLGRIVFTHARILEHLPVDPVANRMYSNLLRHFGRRSVPGEITQPVQQTVVDWLRRERTERARLWRVIGPFPNWEGAGHDTKYPPEHEVDLAGVHAGWRDPVRWLRWYALGEVRNEIDFDDALGLPFSAPATPMPETYYAFAECAAPQRQAATLRLRAAANLKVFINGVLCHESKRMDEIDTADTSISTVLKQGKNSFLIKVSRIRAAAKFDLELLSATRDPLVLNWWR